MLSFYYQAVGIKTQRNTLLHDSTEHHSHSQSNNGKIKSRSRYGKPTQAKQEYQAHLEQRKERNMEQKVEEQIEKDFEPRLRIFKNLAIKQKMRDIQASRVEERIRKKLAQERVQTKEYETSVQQYLANKIKQNIENSQLQKAAERPPRTSVRRHRTLNDQQSRKSQDLLSTVTLTSKDPQTKGQHRKRRSNLLGQEESLLAHILRKQREMQEKTLRVVPTRRGTRASQHQNMHLSSEKWGRFMDDSRTNTLLSHSMRAQLVVALRPPKRSTDTLQPWQA